MSKTSLAALGTFIALDFETTGIQAENDNVIDIGAIKYENGVEVARFVTLVQPEQEVSPEITQLTGITPAMLASAPRWAEIEADFRDFLGDSPIMAHNADFELKFLQKYFGSSYKPVLLDTYRLLLTVFPQAQSHSLENFIREYDIRSHELHRGISDAEDMVAVLLKVDEELQDPRFALLCSIVAHHAGIDGRGWQWSPFFAGRHQTVAIDLRDFKSQYGGDEEQAPVPLDESLSYAPQMLKDATVIRKVFPDYKVRKEQQLLAERAATILTSEGRYVAEAGTGTGKTLAYASAALATLSEDATSPVVVSTHTRALQDQFISVEIPRLKALFETPELKAISLKGMNNYICLKKIDQLNIFSSGGGLFGGEEAFVAIYLHYWALTTKEGERDELPYILLEEAALKPIASNIHADIRDCERDSCPLHEQCFFYKKRWEATSAHIIAINHSLLMSYPRSYPEFSRLIVDEADELYQEAVESFSITAGFAEGLEIIEILFGASGVLSSLHHYNTGEEISEVRRRLREAWGELDAALRSAAVPDLFITHVQIGNGSVAPEHEKRILDALQQYVTIAEGGTKAINDVLKETERQKDNLTDNDRRYKNLLVGYAETFDRLSRAAVLFVEQNTKEHSLSIGVTADNWTISASPYHIEDRFSGETLANVKSAVFTSATLSTKPDHSDFTEPLGIEKNCTDVLKDRFRSPFNYRRQSKIIFLKGFTTSRTPDFPEHAADVIAEIARYLGGRTLGLFTSRDRLTQTHKFLIEKLAPEGFTIISHGLTANSIQKAVDQFKRTDKAVLLGARGLWKGVDIPGNDLQCVVIEKMPYSVPNPYTTGLQRIIIEELREAAIARGEKVNEGQLKGAAWNIVEKPQMFQAFRQMFGRVIRTENDKGAMVVLDPQLQSPQLSQRHKDLLTLLGTVPYSLTFPDRLIHELSFIKEEGFSS